MNGIKKYFDVVLRSRYMHRSSKRLIEKRYEDLCKPLKYVGNFISLWLKFSGIKNKPIKPREKIRKIMSSIPFLYNSY